MGSSWRRTLVRLLIGTAATVAFLILFLREISIAAFGARQPVSPYAARVVFK